MSEALPKEILQHYPLPIQEADLPRGWRRVWLSDIACGINPGFASGEHSADGRGVPHLRPMNVDRDGKIDLSVVKYVASSKGVELQPGDVLFNNTNSPELIGKSAVISPRETGYAYSNHMTCLRLESGVAPTYVAAQLHFLWMTGYSKQRCTNHVNQASISSRALAGSIPFLLPPPSEQQRIVARIDELLSDLDAGVAELKAAQKKQTKYRLSLLKAALEGALTATWRKHNKTTETGEQLLERILKERRARWEEKQLAKFREQGKVPPKDWREKYPAPVRPDIKDLPELPPSWAWASLDMVGEIVSGVAKGTKRASDVAVREVPYLRVANVQRGYLDLGEVKTILATERDIEELTLRAGDVLFNEGGDRDKLGRGWVWRDEVTNCIHQNHVFRLRLFVDDMQPELISHHGNTFGKLWFQRAGKQTTNLASINMGMLRSFPVPVAPADEQREVLSQLEVRMDPLDVQDNYIVLALKQSMAQRKNILKAAFSGQLVPQDPSDEPASAWLERIRSERLAKAESIGKRVVKQRA